MKMNEITWEAIEIGEIYKFEHKSKIFIEYKIEEYLTINLCCSKEPNFICGLELGEPDGEMGTFYKLSEEIQSYWNYEI